MYCTKCQKDYPSNSGLCPECGNILVIRAENDEAENRIPILTEETDLAQRIKDFLDYSNIRPVYEETDAQEGLTRLLVNESSYHEAVKLLRIFNQQEMQRIMQPDPELLEAEKEEKLKEKLFSGENKVYVKKSVKQEDLHSSGTSLISVSIFGLAFGLLLVTDVLPLNLNTQSKWLMFIVLTAMCIIFLITGIRSLSQAASMKKLVEEEDNLTREITDWFERTYTSRDLDSDIDDSLEADETISLTDRQFRRMDLIKTMILSEYELDDESYVDSLCESLYESLYEDSEEEISEA